MYLRDHNIAAIMDQLVKKLLEKRPDEPLQALFAELAEVYASSPRSVPVPVREVPQDAKHVRICIIGSGPAGFTAAIYTGRALLQPLLFEGFLAGGVAAGGQLTTTTEVENFPGFPKGIQGPELMEHMREQAAHCGATIVTETVVTVDLSQRPFLVKTEDGASTALCDALIVATGATAKRLHLPGEETYWQSGVSACAVCDGAAPIFRGKPVAVVGGGDSACEEALFLTKYASKVLLLVRSGTMRASHVMRTRASSHPSIEIQYFTLPIEIKGDGRKMNELVVKDGRTNEERSLQVNGLFYAIGHVPNTAFLGGQLILDDSGYVVTQPGSSRTSVEGVFACGDVQDKRYRQAITAAGSGCMAALDAEHFLSQH